MFRYRYKVDLVGEGFSELDQSNVMKINLICVSGVYKMIRMEYKIN